MELLPSKAWRSEDRLDFSSQGSSWLGALEQGHCCPTVALGYRVSNWSQPNFLEAHKNCSSPEPSEAEQAFAEPTVCLALCWEVWDCISEGKTGPCLQSTVWLESQNKTRQRGMIGSRVLNTQPLGFSLSSLYKKEIGQEDFECIDLEQ